MNRSFSFGMLRAAVALAAMSATPALAATYTWNVSGNGIWATPANWSPVLMYGPGDPANITSSSDVVVIHHPAGTASSVAVNFGDGATSLFRQINKLTLDASTAGTPNTLNIAADAKLRVNVGGVINNGLININGAPFDPATLEAGQDLVLSGTGIIRLGSVAGEGTVQPFTSQDVTVSAGLTVDGRGYILGDQLINHGLIKATIAGQSILAASSNSDVSVFTRNDGTITAINGARVQLSGNGYDNVGGTISADGAGSAILYPDSSSVLPVIRGGVVSATNGAILRTPASSDAFFENVTFNGDIRAGNASDIDLTGAIVNNGTIFAESTSTASTDIEIQAAGATFTGTGKLLLGGSGTNPGINGLSGSILINSAGHTIEGRGRVGGNTLAIDNRGTILANVSGTTLTIDPSATPVPGASDSGLKNTGLIRAEAGTTLAFAAQRYDNIGGTIELDGAGATCTLANSTVIAGGTIRAVNGGVFADAASSNVFFESVTFAGDVRAANNSDFGVTGTITNNGIITVDAGASATDIEVQTAGATFAGTGKIIFGGTGTTAGINGLSSAVLTNGASHTIEGKGRLGQNTISIVNDGTITATDATTPLTIDPDAAGFESHGLVRAQGAAGIALAAGPHKIAAGTLQIDAGSKLTLAASATLTVDTGATFDQANGTTVTLASGATITNSGTYRAGAVTMTGTFANAATGTLVMELGGTTPITQFDQIAGAGIATLAGTLDLRLINGFDPTLYSAPLSIISDTSGSNITGRFTTILNVGTGQKRLAVLYVPSTGNVSNKVNVVAAVAGDADVNGIVGFPDLVALAQNYNQSGRGWQAGDFNGDGVTNFNDLVALAQNYNYGTLMEGDGSTFAADWALAQSLVPEPATAALVMAASSMMLRRRR